jgi:hypothetical protein
LSRCAVLSKQAGSNNLQARQRWRNKVLEGWQNGYCTSLENWRAKALGGSNPSPSVENPMKLGDTMRALRRPKKSPARRTIIRALEFGAGAASALWLSLRVRKQLYGPGGTKLSRHNPSRLEDE